MPDFIRDAGAIESVLPVDVSPNAPFLREMGQISRHSFVFFLGTIFTSGTGYLFRVYLARVLGAEALGVYALGMTIIGFLGIFNAFGLPQSAVRFIAAYSATGKTELLRNFLGRSLFLIIISNALLGGLLLLAGPRIARVVYHTTALNGYFLLFANIMLLGALTTFLAQALAGYKDVTRRTVITNFIGSPLTMILSVIFIIWGAGLHGYILAQVISSAAVLLLLGISVFRLTPSGRSLVRLMFSPLEKQVVSFSALSFGVGFLEFAMAQSDKVLIGIYLDARSVGIYAVAMTLVAFVSIILQSVNQIFAPTIADLTARGERALLARIFQTLTKWTFGFTLPLAAVMIVFAPLLMGIFGRDFAAGWPILVIGTMGQLVNCGVGSVGYLLLMSGHQSDLVRIQTIMAIVMVALGVALIPRWGVYGAAGAAAITNLTSNLWYLWEVRRRLTMSPYNWSYVRLLLPLCATVLVLFVDRHFLFAFRSAWSPIVIALLLGYLVFVAGALAAGLDEDDRMVLEFVRSRLGGRFLTGAAS